MLCCYFCFRKDMDFFKLITAATVNPGRFCFVEKKRLIKHLYLLQPIVPHWIKTIQFNRFHWSLKTQVTSKGAN